MRLFKWLGGLLAPTERTVDTIVANLGSTLSELRDHAEAKAREIVEHDIAIAEAVAKKELAAVEQTRAGQIAENIGRLLGL